MWNLAKSKIILARTEGSPYDIKKEITPLG